MVVLCFKLTGWLLSVLKANTCLKRLVLNWSSWLPHYLVAEWRSSWSSTLCWLPAAQAEGLGFLIRKTKQVVDQVDLWVSQTCTLRVITWSSYSDARDSITCGSSSEMDSGSEVGSGAWDWMFTALAFSKAIPLFSLLERYVKKQVIISWIPWLTPTIPAPMKLRQQITRVWGHIVSTTPASAINSKTLSQTITTNKQSYNNKTFMFDSVSSERVRWYFFSGNQGREHWGYLGSGGSKPRKMGMKE